MRSRYLAMILILVAGLMLFGLMTAGEAVVVDAAPAAVGTRPTPILPPPTGTPFAGGFIELRLDPGRGNVWTEMQWRGVGDAWHDVDGWRGAPDEAGVVRWYVGPEHLGQGPFRWQVYDQDGRRLLGSSEPFYLPDRPRATLTVTVELAQPSQE